MEEASLELLYPQAFAHLPQHMRAAEPTSPKSPRKGKNNKVVAWTDKSKGAEGVNTGLNCPFSLTPPDLIRADLREPDVESNTAEEAFGPSPTALERQHIFGANIAGRQRHTVIYSRVQRGDSHILGLTSTRTLTPVDPNPN